MGLNEVIWMEEPSIEIVEYGIRSIGGVKPETAKGWEKLLLDSGQGDIVERDAMALPRDFMKYFGYGIYAGKKPL